MFKLYGSLSANRTNYDTLTIDSLVSKINTPKEAVTTARQFDKYNNRNQYDYIKVNNIECFYPNEFNGSSTGYIYLDIDGFHSVEETLKYKEYVLLKHHLLICACWISLSGYGLSILVKVKGLNKINYNTYLFSLNELFESRLDSQAKGYSKVTCISYDPCCYYNADSILYAINDPNPTGNNSYNTNNPANTVGSGTTVILQEDNTRCTRPPYYQTIYYSTPFPDTHFIDINSPLFYPDGISIIEIDLKVYNKRKIRVGERHKILGALSMQLIVLNPLVSGDIRNLRKQLSNALLSINRYYTVEPLSKDELIRMFNANYKKYQISGLDVSKYMVKKKFIWHRECNLSGNDKKSIIKQIEYSHKGYGATHKKPVIYDAIETLIAESVFITRKEIMKITGYGETSIKTYWKDFKSVIDEHNRQILTVRNSAAEAIKMANKPIPVKPVYEEYFSLNFLLASYFFISCDTQKYPYVLKQCNKHFRHAFQA